MKRPWRIWVAFAVALAMLLAAMGSVSVTALRLDHQAILEESVRLALWRMDSAVAPLIAQENARPYFAYGAFYPAERAYTKMFAEIDRDEVLLPSPLLTGTSEHVVLHFQFGPKGELTSPQVPTGNMRDLAETGYATTERIEAAAARLAELRRRVDPGVLLAALPAREAPQLLASPQEANELALPPGGQQAQRNLSEYQARYQTFQRATAQSDQPAKKSAARPYAVTEAVLRPVWVGGLLLLVRRVATDRGEYLQGCWLDWPGIERWLLDHIRGLLPQARLEPLVGDGADPRLRVLASLPVRLVPGPLPAGSQPLLSPIRISLAVAWCGAIVAAAAVAILLVGAVSLSERRAAFVSAVSHELRTPLTTFQLYSEMLAEDMVTDEKKRHSYVRTLCNEADRLSHLVENVLAYARLERGRPPARPETIRARDLVERVRDRLARRAQRDGMELVVEMGCGDAVAARADCSAVEQILLNLVDNACKYASGAGDRRIHLDVAASPGPRQQLELRVRDHGPGLSADARRRLFEPFSKSAQDAARSKPGVGLGLALSRRLARDMGGDLWLDDRVPDGACFVLSLPLS